MKAAYSSPELWLIILHLPLLALSSDCDNRNVFLACNTLQASLGRSIIQDNHGPDYQSTITGAWNLFNTQFQPTCIVFPRQSSHVQVAMQSIYTFDVNYAVQAGGHSAMKGWNNVNDGILISFKFMNNISYNPSKDTIILEPAVRWGESVTALESQGVSPVGGRVDDVGTGLLLGGGLSFLSPTHGYAADNYVELDVVLVDGTLVTATASNEYSDLFRALKGGANRFGVVTRYEVRAIHTGSLIDKTWFGGSIAYPNTSFDAVAQAVSRYTRDVSDPNAAILVYFAAIALPDASLTNLAIANLYYNGTSQLPENIFGEFLSIPSIPESTMLTSLSWPDIAFSLTEPLPSDGHGQTFACTVLAGDEDDSLYVDVVREWTNFTTSFRQEFNTSVLAFTPIPVSQIMIGRERGGNAFDSNHSSVIVPYNQIHVQVTLPLGVPQMSPEMEEGRQLFIKQAPRSLGFPLYINECDAEQNVFETYGQYEFLKQTYMKYDPTRFNIRRTAGPPGL